MLCLLPWGHPQPIPCPWHHQAGRAEVGTALPTGNLPQRTNSGKSRPSPVTAGLSLPSIAPFQAGNAPPQPLAGPRRAPSPSPRTTSLTGGLPGGSLGRDGGRGGGGGGVPHVASGVPGRAGDEEPARNGAVSAPRALPPPLPTPEPPGAAHGHGTAQEMCMEHSRMAHAPGFRAGDAQCTVLSVNLLSVE